MNESGEELPQNPFQERKFPHPQVDMQEIAQNSKEFFEKPKGPNGLRPMALLAISKLIERVFRKWGIENRNPPLFR